jgi:hypothetical protein
MEDIAGMENSLKNWYVEWFSKKIRMELKMEELFIKNNVFIFDGNT